MLPRLTLILLSIPRDNVPALMAVLPVLQGADED